MDNQLNMMDQAIQSQQRIQQTAPIESEHMGKWEMDVEPWLTRIYHDLLGETLNPNNALWELDEKKQRIMNELGASEFIADVSSRVSIHMQMSELEEEDIQESASRAAEIFSDKIEDNWELWQIRPSKANCESIGQRMYDIIFIGLRIAKKGGMRKHREKSKNPYSNIPQPQEGIL